MFLIKKRFEKIGIYSIFRSDPVLDPEQDQDPFFLGLYRIMIWPDIRPIILPDTGKPDWPDIPLNSKYRFKKKK